MRALLIIGLLALAAGPALAQFDGDNMIGIFFDPANYSQETTNHDTDGDPFNAYLVMLNATVETIGGYECAIEFSDPSVFILGLVGDNGWTNFGDNLNHLVGFQEPLPTGDPGTVLATFTCLYSATDLVEIRLGPSDPASIPDVMAITDGENPDDIIPCYCTTPDCMVATLNGNGVVGVEHRTWSDVKALYE